MTKQINAARAFGSVAFANGIVCAPACDKNLMDLIAGMKVGGGSIKIMKAWIAGWTDANLA